MPKIFGSWQSFRQIRLCIAPSTGHARASPEPAFSLTHHVSVIELTTSPATFPIHRQTIGRSSPTRIVAECRYNRPDTTLLSSSVCLACIPSPNSAHHCTRSISRCKAVSPWLVAVVKASGELLRRSILVLNGTARVRVPCALCHDSMPLAGGCGPNSCSLRQRPCATCDPSPTSRSQG
jgi:hypothetical protein